MYIVAPTFFPNTHTHSPPSLHLLDHPWLSITIADAACVCLSLGSRCIIPSHTWTREREEREREERERGESAHLALRVYDITFIHPWVVSRASRADGWMCPGDFKL